MAERTLVGIDIGTRKVAALVATAAAGDALTVVAGASAPARGMRQGVVVDIAEVTRALAEVIERVEQLSGRTVTAATVALAGQHLAAANTEGTVALTPGGREVRYEDIARAIELARRDVPPGGNRELIHQVPRGYYVDDPYDYGLPPAPYGCAWIYLGDEIVLIDLNSGEILQIADSY